MLVDYLYVNLRSVCLTFNHIVILYPHTSDSAILLLRAVLVCVQIPKRQLVWAQNNYHSFGNSCTYLKSDTWFAHNEYDFKGRTFWWRDTIHSSYRLKEDSTWPDMGKIRRCRLDVASIFVVFITQILY